MTEFIISAVVGIVAQFFFMGGAAKYAKYCLKIRDYLNMLFPVEMYPKGIAFEGKDLSTFNGMSKDKVAVPISAVAEATKTHGFNIPFVKNR